MVAGSASSCSSISPQVVPVPKLGLSSAGELSDYSICDSAAEVTGCIAGADRSTNS